MILGVIIVDKLYRKIIQNSDVGYAYHKVVCNRDGVPYDYKCIETNKAFERYTGLRAENFTGEKINKILPDKSDRQVDLIEYYERIVVNGERKEYEKYLKDTDRWCKMEVFSTEKYYFVTSCIDITEQKNLENTLKNNRLRNEQMARKSRSIVWEIDKDGMYTYVSPVVESVLGYRPDEMIGKKYIYEAVRREEEEEYKELILSMISKRESISDFENKLITKDNKEIWVSSNGFPVFYDEDQLIFYRGISIDISHLKIIEEEIRFLSFRDQLTGLYNRRFFEEELDRLDTERNLPLSLIVIDVDGLKLVNDAFGHRAGDLLLKKVASILEKGSRADDIVSRLGGDEFAILLPKTSLDKATSIISRINREIKKETVEAINLSISYGCDAKINIYQNIEDVLKKADMRMYKYKNSRNGKLRKEIIEKILERLFEKSPEEREHSKGVSGLSSAIGRALNLDEKEIKKLRILGKFHDIGKIVISEDILTKKDKLTQEEWEEVKRHSELGYIILSSSSEYISFAEDVLYHHERYDGKGYPRGLEGEEIPLNSRIIALADAYDIMTSDRPYKKAVSRDHAIELILRESGKQFDPSIVEAFLSFNIGI